MPIPISSQWIDAELRKAIDPVTIDRLFLIVAVRDYPEASSPEIARLAAISESRARSWRAVLLKSGPTCLLRMGRRISEKGADSTLHSDPFPEPPTDSRSALLALFHFHESAPRVDDPAWMEQMKVSLQGLKPNAHRASLTLRPSADFSVGLSKGRTRTVNHIVGEPEVGILPDISYSHMWKQHLHGAIWKGHMSFANYSFPIARDYHDPKTGEKIGAAFFFRGIDSRPFAKADHDMIDLYQPFLTNTFLSRILWLQERNSLAGSFSRLLPTLFPGNRSLTSAEEPVALQMLLGKSDQEIADALHLNVSTIRSHVRKILRKSGVGSRGQLMASVLMRDLISSDPPIDP